MRPLLKPLLLLAGFAVLLLGCSDSSEPVIPPTDTQAGQPSLMKSTESGAMILKFEVATYFLFYDAEEGLVLSLGINDLAEVCGGGTPFDVFDYKELYLPGTDPNLRRLVRQMKGEDVGAIVWATETWPVALCTIDPLAVGTADVIRTDNDLYANTQDNPNADAFGYKAHGSLLGPEGQTYRLNLVYRAIWDGVDLSSLKQIVKIQLTPTGSH